MSYRRRTPARRHSDPRCYRTRDSTFELDRMNADTEHARISGKVLLIQNNGTLEGAVGIQRKRTDNTLAIQHWTNLFYNKDWNPVKWIIPVTKNSEGKVRAGESYVEAVGVFGEKVYELPELSKREQKQVSVLHSAIEQELAKIELSKKPLGPALKGQVRKSITPAYYKKAEKVGREVHFSRLELHLPWRI